MELPSNDFQPRVYGVGAWTDNLPFAYDVVATLRPRLLVELGTDRGESYFAFCQSIAENKTGTRCFAIDTWQGDEQAGGYDETTFTEVSDHNRAHYGSFSTLLRCRFDEALEKFASESIDVLHLDGLHTEAAVRHDLGAWLPKLAPGGILLMHDVSVRRPEFGVWKVWDELRTRSRSYTFADGPGLGVWQKPPAIKLPDPLDTLFNGAANELAHYYRGKAQALQERIGQDWRDGSIRNTAGGQQTIVQIFHTHDGIHREGDSLVARLGHEVWRDLALTLPKDAGAAPLRIDFLSAFTTIDVSLIGVNANGRELFRAENAQTFDQILIAGDSQRLEHPDYLRLKITGPDPQLHLPPLSVRPESTSLEVRLRLRVSAQFPSD